MLVDQRIVLFASNADWRRLIVAGKGMPPKQRRFLYLDYLRSSAWKNKRVQVMKRAQNHCEQCWFSPAIEIHHLTYANLGDEPLEELAALCRDCHAARHNKGPSFMEQVLGFDPFTLEVEAEAETQ